MRKYSLTLLSRKWLLNSLQNIIFVLRTEIELYKKPIFENSFLVINTPAEKTRLTCMKAYSTCTTRRLYKLSSFSSGYIWWGLVVNIYIGSLEIHYKYILILDGSWPFIMNLQPNNNNFSHIWNFEGFCVKLLFIASNEKGL